MNEIIILKKIDNYYLVQSIYGDTQVIDEESLKKLISYNKVFNYEDFIYD
jgi:hypothetical protein